MKTSLLLLCAIILCASALLADTPSTNVSWVTPPPTPTPTPDSSTGTGIPSQQQPTISVNPSPIVINMLPMGNPPQYGITQNCITVNQYCAFLNAVATTGDTYNLYTNALGVPTRAAACITCAPAPNGKGWQYSVVQGQNRISSTSDIVLPTGEFPIIYVSLLDAARFCNWMENGQPIGPEGPGTTETGSYTITLTTNTTPTNTIPIIPSHQTITLNPGSTWSLVHQDPVTMVAESRNPQLAPNIDTDQWMYFESCYASGDPLQNQLFYEWTDNLYNPRLDSKFYLQVKPNSSSRQFLASTKLYDTGFRLIMAVSPSNQPPTVQPTPPPD